MRMQAEHENPGPDRWTDELGPVRHGLRRRTPLDIYQSLGRSRVGLIFLTVWLGLVAGVFVAGGFITVFPDFKERFGESSGVWVLSLAWVLYSTSTIWCLIRRPRRPSFFLHREGIRIRSSSLGFAPWHVFPFLRIRGIRFGVGANWFQRELEKGKHGLARLNSQFVEAAVASERERAGTLVVRDIDNKEHTFRCFCWQYEFGELEEVLDIIALEQPHLFAMPDDDNVQSAR
jgi:hypothetical protein